jgi:hypothetical protein
MAPECLAGNSLSKPADVYSFAVAGWELFTSELPFRHIISVDLHDVVGLKQQRLPRPKNMTNDDVWHQIIVPSWDSSPSSRPDFNTIQARLKYILSGKCDSSRSAATFLFLNPHVFPTESKYDLSTFPAEESGSGSSQRLSEPLYKQIPNERFQSSTLVDFAPAVLELIRSERSYASNLALLVDLYQRLIEGLSVVSLHPPL